MEYWSMKKELLRKKQDPTVFASKEVQRKTRGFVVNHSNLKDQEFWHHLDENDQETAMKCFTMQEVPAPRKEILFKNRWQAAVFVCLSGSATIKNSKTNHERRYGAGEIFGELDLFTKIVRDKEPMDLEHPDEKGPSENIIHFGEGTFMRMQLKDLFSSVISPDPALEEAVAFQRRKETAEQISGIPWDNMTEEDKFFVRIYERTRELVNKQFFCFLDSYKMVPRNAGMASHRYLNQGNKGRDAYLDGRDQTWVFIILDGSLRLELVPTKEYSAEHTISCIAADGNKSIHVKVRTASFSIKCHCEWPSHISYFAVFSFLLTIFTTISVDKIFAFDATVLWLCAVFAARLL
jgi:hypothetical protein